MQIESDPVSPIRPVGSRTNISVYLKLSTHSNIPVTVHTAWNGPNQLSIRDTATLINRENTTKLSPTYTSIITITNFQRRHSGLYYCTATVLFSFSRFSDGDSSTAIARVTVGKPVRCKRTNDAIICMILYSQRNRGFRRGLSLPLPNKES